MSIADQMKTLTVDIISSYEGRISAIESIFSDTHQLLDDFQKALFETHEERDRLCKELEENLAKTESLRRKDFDQMMQTIFGEQNEREKEVRNLLHKYLNEQKDVARTLKESLADFNKKLMDGEQIRIDEYRQRIVQIREEQLKRQNEVKQMLKDFQNKVQEYRRENEKLASEIKELLAKGESIRIRDFKAMLKGFQKGKTEARDAWHNLSLAMAKKRSEAKEVMLNK